MMGRGTKDRQRWWLLGNRRVRPQGHKVVGGATLLLLWLGLAVSAGQGATSRPVDPLQPAPIGGGSMEYGFGFQLAPGATVIPGQDAAGRPVPTVMSQYGLILQGDFQYSLSERLGVFADIQGHGLVRLGPSVGSGPARRGRGHGPTWSGAVGLSWRPAPDHLSDPTVLLRAEVGGHGEVSVQIHGRRLADPVVLYSMFGLSGAVGSPPRLERQEQREQQGGQQQGGQGSGLASIGMGGGVAFVFNDRFVGRAHLAHHVPLTGGRPPVTALTIGVGRQGGEFTQGADYDVTFIVDGVDLALQFGVTWRGQRRHRSPRD